MNFRDKVRKILDKLRALPESRKKILLWLVVAVLAIIMAIFWFNTTINRFSNLSIF